MGGHSRRFFRQEGQLTSIGSVLSARPNGSVGSTLGSPLKENVSPPPSFSFEGGLKRHVKSSTMEQASKHMLFGVPWPKLETGTSGGGFDKRLTSKKCLNLRHVVFEEHSGGKRKGLDFLAIAS